MFAIASFCLPRTLAAQGSEDKEARAEAYLSQADELYSAGNYSKAIDNYLQASHIAQKKTNLSRAYMGLSLCYFYLNETDNAKKYILKVLETDPRKEVSDLFHPQTYVDLFDQVRNENADKLALIKTEEAAPEQVQEEPGKVEKQAPAIKGMISDEEKAGRWEIEVHFSGWSINPAKSLFEDELTKKAAEEIREHMTDQLNASHGGNLIPTFSEQKLSLGSEGSNYGFEVRYYPLGRRGALSVGASLEKTRMRINMRGPVTQGYSDGSTAVVESDGYAETNPVTGNVSFRWDFFPSWRITPYFVFGVGFGPLGGTFSYVYTGTYQRGGSQAGVQGEDTKTFDQLREEGDIRLDLIILLQMAIGVKGEVYKGIFVKGEVGFWDGLIFRGGVGYRF
jgi:Tfp pilus assembly protein PilF